jgi:hypothetical protein
MPEKRRNPRVHCSLLASTQKDEVVIDELGPEGGCLVAPFEAARGEELLLTIYEQGGAKLAFEAEVCRVWKTPVSCRMAWRVSSEDPARAQVLELFARVSGTRCSRSSSLFWGFGG